MRKITDQELIRNYLRGDEESLEILIKRYLRPIYSFTFRFIGNTQEAEDITQEVFVRAWLNLKKFNQKKSFKTWIFTIAKNTSLDWLRKKRTIPFSELEYTTRNKFFIANIPDTNPLPKELLEREDLVALLNKTLEKLPLKYQMVLFLRYNDHFKFKEIAEILEKPINTIKSYHRRALILLRNYIKNKEILLEE